MNRQFTFASKVIRGSTIVIFFTILLSPIGYLIRMLYSQTLSIELYGLFYAVLTLFTLLTTYNDLGFGYSLIYFLPKYLKQKNYAASWNMYKIVQYIELGTSLILSLILLLLANWLTQNYFKVPEAKNLIYIFCIYLISNSFLSALINLFNGLQKEILYSSIHFFRLLFTLLFSLIFWIIGSINVIYYALTWAAAYIVVGVIYSYLLNKDFKYLTQNNFKFDKVLYKKMQSYAIPTLLTTSIFYFSTYTDTLFLTLFRGVKEVGIYNIILPLVTISSILLSPLNNFLIPLISHSMEGEKGNVQKILEVILKIIPFVGVYFSLFLILFPSISVSLLFGQKWSGLVETPLIILALGYIIMPLSTYLTTIISGLGKVRERLYASVVIAILSFILNGIFVFKFGLIGAVLANLVVFLISIIIFGEIVKKVIHFKYPFIFYSKLLISSLTIFIIVKILRINPINFWQFILSGIIYTLVILLLGIYFKLIDINFLKTIFKLRDEKQ